MSLPFHLPLSRLCGHAMVRMRASTATALRDSSATQRRFRHTPKSYSAPQRLRTPAKGYRAVQARRLLQEIERLKGTRFSQVTVKPKAPSNHCAAYLRALRILKPGSTTTSKALKFFKRGLAKRFSSLSSIFGWAPVEWPGSILFIDLANCGGRLNVRNLNKSVKANKSALNDLVQFSQSRGCRVLVMVEGSQRNMPAPTGIRMIRAQPIKRKDVGDDAIVDCIHSTVKEGIETSRIVLVTDDKGLIRRMPLGVKWRSPNWLASEIVALLAETELGHLPLPVPSAAIRANNAEAAGSVIDSEAKRPILGSESSWRVWWDPLRLLRSFPTLFWSLLGSDGGHHRGEVGRNRPLGRSP